MRRVRAGGRARVGPETSGLIARFLGRLGRKGNAHLSAGPAGLAQANPKPPSGIYSCIDDKGRRITADRPIPECTHREQQVLNRDGSVRTILPPTLTAEERAEREARDDTDKRARARELARPAAAERAHGGGVGGGVGGGGGGVGGGDDDDDDYSGGGGGGDNRASTDSNRRRRQRQK